MTTEDRRELRSLLLGRRIDRLFLLECWRLRLDPYYAIEAPLDAIIGTPTKTNRKEPAQ